MHNCIAQRDVARPKGGFAHMLNCDYLVEFAVAAREGSLTKAAEKLSISQSCLSRHIKALETELQLQLVERSFDGIKLTANGRRIFNRAADMLEIAKDVEYCAHVQQAEVPIAIGGLEDYPSRAHLLYEKYRAITGRDRAVLRMLSHSELAGMSAAQALREGLISGYVTYPTDSELHDLDGAYRTSELFHPQMMAIMEEHHPLAAKERLAVHDLDGQIIFRAESSVMRASTNWNDTKEIFRKHGVDYRFVTGTFERESDWYYDFGKSIVMMPKYNRGLDLCLSYGKEIRPVEGLHYTFVIAYRGDDDRMGWVEGVSLDD